MLVTVVTAAVSVLAPGVRHALVAMKRFSHALLTIAHWRLRCASISSVVKLQLLHCISTRGTNSIGVNSYIELRFSPKRSLLTA
jgi:hypothetical protein